MDLKTLPVWFLVLLVFVFGSYFVLTLKAFIKKLDQLIDELFESRNDHESRISRLEGEHAVAMKTQHQ